MASQDMADRSSRLQGGVKRIDCGSGNAEGDRDALPLQNAYRGIDRSHLRHWRLAVLLTR